MRKSPSDGSFAYGNRITEAEFRVPYSVISRLVETIVFIEIRGTTSISIVHEVE